jgi:hypothetical protein
MAAVAQAAPVVTAAAAHTVYLPAACRGISPRAANGTTTGAFRFRWRPRRRTLARPARRGSRATVRGRGLGLVVVAEFGGTYEDGFEDVHKVRNITHGAVAPAALTNSAPTCSVVEAGMDTFSLNVVCELTDDLPTYRSCLLCVQNIINYFTYKATHTVLHQLYEMNPPAYTWLYR